MVEIKEKIKEVIDKINEDILKEDLSKNEVEQILNNIDDKLEEIEETAEEKQIIGETIEELRNKIDKGLKLRWNRAKGMLSEVKGKLEELRNKIIELEKPLQVVPFSGGEDYILSMTGRTDSEELAAWKNFFRGQSPELVFKHVEGLENFFLQTNSALKDAKNKNDVAELSGEVTKSAETYLRLAREAGDASGLGIFITPVASIVAVGGSVVHGVTVAGAGVFENTRDSAERLAGKGFENADKIRESAEKITSQVLDNAESFRKGAENVTIEVVDNLTEVATSFFDIFKGNDSLEERLKAAEQCIETLKQQLERRDNQLKQQREEFNQRLNNRDGQLKNQEEMFKRQLEDMKEQIAKLKEEYEQRLEDRNARIEKKDKRIEDLEKDIKELNTKYLTHVESHVEVGNKS